jgi:FkbM family methyltransferase
MEGSAMDGPTPMTKEGSEQVYAVEVRSGTRFEIVVGTEADDPLSLGYAQGEYGETYRRLLETTYRAIGPRGRVLDLGGHIGSFALAAAALGYEVVTIEASPRNANLLLRSAAVNGFERLRVIHAAVADRPGTLRFHVAGPYGHVVRDGGSGIEVRAARVDDLLDELGWERPDFIKLDVEGSEIAAIRGMRRRLSRPDAPHLYYESNGHTLNFFGREPADLLGEVATLGYRVYLIRGERLVPVDRGHFQGQTCVDYVALKHVPEGLRAAIAGRSQTIEETLVDVLMEARHPVVDCRAYIARALARAPREIGAHPDTLRALHDLRKDPEPAVRAAASWSGRSVWGELFSWLRRRSA